MPMICEGHTVACKNHGCLHATQHKNTSDCKIPIVCNKQLVKCVKVNQKDKQNA